MPQTRPPQPTGDVGRDVEMLLDYVFYLSEQLDYTRALLQQHAGRLSRLEKGEDP